MLSKLTTKQLGDAGEHFALSMLAFNGFPGVKASGNWPDYDLLVRCGVGEIRTVSVKTSRKRTQMELMWRDSNEIDYLVYVIVSQQSGVPSHESWIIPVDVAKKHASGPDKRQDCWIGLKKLNSESELLECKNAWTIK